MWPYPTICEVERRQSVLLRPLPAPPQRTTTHAERLAPNLPASLGDLVPDPLSHLDGAVADLTREGHDLADNELGDGARVGEGGVEDGDTRTCGGEEVDLVGADAEATDHEELSRIIPVSLYSLFLFRKRERLTEGTSPMTRAVTLVLLLIPTA